MTCREVEDNLAEYVDGVATADPAIATHLETCAACLAAANAQSVALTVLRARGAQLSPSAPPGLRTRITANIDAELTAARPQDRTARPFLGWTGRLSAFTAAAMVVLMLGLPVATVRSTAVLAAQLALDHLKCFTIDGDADGQPIEKAAAEATLQKDFDFAVSIPASQPSQGLALMAVRRCLYGDGLGAHVMYRVNGEPVSLFVLPGLSRPASELSLLGHDEVVWSQGDRTYMVVARAGLGSELSHVASYLRTEAR